MTVTTADDDNISGASESTPTVPVAEPVRVVVVVSVPVSVPVVVAAPLAVAVPVPAQERTSDATVTPAAAHSELAYDVADAQLDAVALHADETQHAMLLTMPESWHSRDTGPEAASQWEGLSEEGCSSDKNCCDRQDRWNNVSRSQKGTRVDMAESTAQGAQLPL